MRYFSLLICLALFFVAVSCKCSKLTYIKNPIFSEDRGYSFNLCREDDIRVGFARDIRHGKSNYILPNDSAAFDYTAGLSFVRYINDSITLVNLLVGKGSEFEAGGCLFRVVKVEYRTKYDSDSMYTLKPFVLFQTLKLPKYCICQNRKLKKFEEQMQDPVFRRKATSFGLKPKEDEEGLK